MAIIGFLFGGNILSNIFTSQVWGGREVRAAMINHAFSNICTLHPCIFMPLARMQQPCHTNPRDTGFHAYLYALPIIFNR